MTQRQPTQRRWRHLAWLMLALALVLGGAGSYFGWRHKTAMLTPEFGGPTLLVLPLRPVGTLHDEGVLAEGLSEELIAPLARISGLRLIGHVSALRAATDHLDAGKLAERLGVTHVLSGSLRELWPQVHVELRLSSVGGGDVLWTQIYDRSLADMPLIERDVTQAVAAVLQLPAPAAAAPRALSDPEPFRDFLEARRLLNGPERARGLDLLRSLVARAPEYARAQAALARTLMNSVRAGSASAADLSEAETAATRAADLDPDLAEAHTALAVIACRQADWPNCMQSFERALALDGSDVECRNTYAYWLAALGYVERALHEAEAAWRADPLSYNAKFSYARLLDTAGRHDGAAQVLAGLNAESGGLIYAKWHNAVWRQDFATASKLTAQMPRSDGFREAYTVVSEALSEPRLWPQALPLIATSERASGGINVQRIMMPNPDYGIVITGLEKMLRDGWPSYYMLLWMPEYAAMRRTPAFQDFLKRTGLLEYWRSHGWPAQCRADGDGASCD